MTDLPAFLTLLAVAYAVPGPDFFVITAAATQSRGDGRRAAAGVVTGLTVHAALAIVGVSALVLAVGPAFVAVRLAGAAYLLRLGLGLVRAPAATATRTGPRRAPYRAGLGSSLLNPKTYVFFVALLPQFIDRAQPVLPQTLALSAIVVAAGAAWWTLVVSVEARHGDVLARRRTLINRGGGAALVVLALALATGA